MAGPTYRTLGVLRRLVLARLGMGGMGASGGANQVLIDSFLQEGQKILYHLQDWNNLKFFDMVDIGTTQNQVDFPASCVNERRILRIERLVAGQWTELREGIETQHWNTMDTLGYPARYERLEQLLFWPKADQVYNLRVWRIRDLSRFEQEDDRCTIDDSMVLLHAITFAKAHYKQADASAYQGQLDTLLASIRALSFGSNGVYTRTPHGAAMQRPLVVGRDVGPYP